jgi:hypothetical protein
MSHFSKAPTAAARSSTHRLWRKTIATIPGEGLLDLPRPVGPRYGPVIMAQWRCGGVANEDIRVIAKREPASQAPSTAMEIALAPMAQILLCLTIAIDAARAAVVNRDAPQREYCLPGCEQVALTSNPGYIL